MRSTSAFKNEEFERTNKHNFDRRWSLINYFDTKSGCDFKKRLILSNLYGLFGRMNRIILNNLINSDTVCWLCCFVSFILVWSNVPSGSRFPKIEKQEQKPLAMESDLFSSC